LRQLQYFVEVSVLESVTKAAERLHVAQSALSSSSPRMAASNPVSRDAVIDIVPDFQPR